MEVLIDETERKVLLGLLRAQCDSLRLQIRHSETPSFTDELRRERDNLLRIIKKLEVAETPLAA